MRHPQTQGFQRFFTFFSVAATCLLLCSCAPRPTDQGGGTPGDTTTGTASSQSPGFEDVRDDHTSISMEHRAQPAPFPLPFPDADPAVDVDPNSTRGGQFIYVNRGDGPKSFDPVSANEQPSTDLLQVVFSALIAFDAKEQKYVPGLLKEWYMEENKAHWILRLRQGIKWSDGHPITSDDILFTFKVIYDEKISNPGRDVLRFGGKNIEFDRIDDYTVRAKLAAPSGSFQPTIASVQLVPKHAYEQAYMAGQPTSTGWNTLLNINIEPAKLICSGPFKLKQYQKGERVILERNPHFYRYDKNGTQLPYLDNVIYTYAPDQDAMVLRFRRGEADGLQRPRAQDVPDLTDSQKAESFTLHDLGPGLFTHLFWFNLKQGNNPDGKPYVDPVKSAWFNDDRFRQACLHALDKENMIRTELRGQAQNVWNMVSPVLRFWYNPDVAKYPFDREKAKALLEQAGMKDTNGDGIREDSKGNKISFTIVTNKDNKLRERLSSLITQDLREVGLDVRVQVLEFNTLITQTSDSFDYEACLLGLSGGGIHPSLSLNVYRSSGRTHLSNPQQEKPATPWEAEIDQLAEQLNSTLDFGEQRKIFFRMQTIWGEHCPILPLFNEHTFVATRNKFGNLKPNVIGELMWNADEFYLKK